MNELLLPAVSPADALLIQKYAGMCLLGTNPVQRLLLIDGLAGSGKSTLVRIIQKLVGLTNVTELRTRHLSERFELSRYLTKTLLCGVDVPGDFLSHKGSHVIKGLVGGDWFDAEKKGSNASFQMQGAFCMLITSNVRLHVKLDGDLGAWKRRIVIVHFDGAVPKKKIPNFADKLIEEEGSGILNWALEGLGLLFDAIDDIGDIRLAAEQKKCIKVLLEESDSLYHFLSECVSKEFGSDLTAQELFEAYARYCPARGWTPKTKTEFHRELDDLMSSLFHVTKAHSIERDNKAQRGYRNVKLTKWKD